MANETIQLKPVKSDDLTKAILTALGVNFEKHPVFGVAIDLKGASGLSEITVRFAVSEGLMRRIDECIAEVRRAAEVGP